MLSWQRTAYHFQPKKNWINDPNGPMFYKGWYHLFYQYNPDAAVWGNITWGHAVSKDLIHWLYLPLAMVRNEWYDINGVWTGSATLLPDDTIVMIYTGSTNESVQVQNVAYPANHSDPLLLDWVKYSGNSVWRFVIGTKIDKTGVAIVYETTDFLSYKLLDGLLHEVPTTGMWECIDFYPVSTTDANRLDTSVNGPEVKHVLKASLDDNKKDFYALGTYDSVKNTWTPDDPEFDVGIGIRCDYGKFYAAKSFYDQHKGMRILWGWIGETDSETADIKRAGQTCMLSSLTGYPREVTFDMKIKTNIIQWPVEEVESLRLNSTEFKEAKVEAGSIIPLYTDTTIYFYIAKDTDGSLKTFFCERTFGVLSKLDLMDKGTNATEVSFETLFREKTNGFPTNLGQTSFRVLRRGHKFRCFLSSELDFSGRSSRFVYIWSDILLIVGIRLCY
ncbi:beta-fructofuranosidase [Ranunculus cassubicifolius]